MSSSVCAARPPFSTGTGDGGGRGRRVNINYSLIQDGGCIVSGYHDDRVTS